MRPVIDCDVLISAVLVAVSDCHGMRTSHAHSTHGLRGAALHAAQLNVEHRRRVQGAFGAFKT